ncbi:MAG TPA: molybdopterin dinucleotide binding domain-containing protein, partial [Acidimicrobiia bacterium]|nr:molybdopterin dinucleotide binding domain-containing protein [Acidimicrobiia bacterium]
LHSARTMYDDGVMMRQTPSLHRLARGAAAYLHPDDARRIGTAEGRRVRLTGRHVEADLDVVLDDTLSRGVVYVPYNQPDGPRLGSDPVVRVTASA